MGDTLRSIAEGMYCDYSFNSIRYGEKGWEHDPTKCPKCRFLALLAEYEKVDLVKTWREDAKPFLDYHGIGSVILKCADELETWLAVNLERIKAEARQDGEASAYKSAIALLHSFSSHADRGEVLGILRGLQDMSEGKTRTLEEVRAALEAQAKEKP